MRYLALYTVGLSMNTYAPEFLWLHDHMQRTSILCSLITHCIVACTAQKNRSVRDRSQHNKGCAWVVVVELKDETALAQYGPHPEHTKVQSVDDAAQTRISSYVSQQQGGGGGGGDGGGGGGT